jgi:hypothetical protein
MKPRSSAISSASAVPSAEARVAAYDWQALACELDNYGCAVLPKLLSREECRTIAALYSDESHFRSHVNMARHGFGKGEYRYSDTRFRTFSIRYERGSIRASQLWLMNGMAEWESTNAIPRITHRSSNDATMPVRRAQRRFCCSMSQVTSIASTKTSMAFSHSRSRSRFSSRSPAWTSGVVSSSWPNSGRACKAAPRSYHFGRVMLWPSQFIIVQSRVRRATTV